ncbi:MAG TPA: hypothetical protein VG845_05895 [Dehalococcoidia bacterium]|jgi:DNA-directed RNA polymerase subunit M/transcription elongation factor TFIIS|nr:hypothetical protein [Dehalococcoidia bacterium]
MTRNPRHKLLLHACPRCSGDLFPEQDEKDVFACLQCGRRIPAAQISLAAPEPAVLAPAA